METVLVTGATGFVGGRLARRLLDEGFRVIGAGRREMPGLVAAGVELRRGDLSDPDFCSSLCRGVRTVYHVAAKAGIWGDPKAFAEANVVASDHLLEAARRSGVESFVFTSTPSVTYNGKPIRNGDETLPYTTSRISTYAWTKRVAEERIVKSDTPGGMRTIALRPHLIVGPGDNHLLPTLLERAQSGRLKIVGSGRNRVDITHVDNVVDAHLGARRALEQGDAGGKAYFITNGEPVELWPWVNRFLEEAGVAPLRRKVPFPVAYAVGAVCEGIWKLRRKWTNPPMTRFAAAELAKDHYFSPSRAETDLGYTPRATTEAAVEAFLRQRPNIGA